MMNSSSDCFIACTPILFLKHKDPALMEPSYELGLFLADYKIKYNFYNKLFFCIEIAKESRSKESIWSSFNDIAFDFSDFCLVFEI